MFGTSLFIILDPSLDSNLSLTDNVAKKALLLSNVWFSHNFIHEANGFISAVYTELEIIEFSNNRKNSFIGTLRIALILL